MQDRKASLKIYQLTYSLPSSLVHWCIETARLCQHHRIGIGYFELPQSHMIAARH
jgi:hypothetical protein